MSAMIPALIDIIHHVAVVAGRRVVSQVSGEIGDIKYDTTESQYCHETNYQGIFHLLSLLIKLTAFYWA